MTTKTIVQVPFQTVDMKVVNRADHVWYSISPSLWKCVLCGGMSESPPHFPTPADWTPDRYGALCEQERQMSPASK
jgi:hypothetical protein